MKPVNNPDAPKESCSPYLTYNKKKYIFEVDASLTLDPLAWKKYEFELSLIVLST
jgi:hypothetical protein